MNGNAVGILESMTFDGYMNNQDQKMNRFTYDNSQSLNNYLENHPYQNELAKNPNFGYINSCADTYPNNTNKEYIEQRQMNLSGFKNTGTNKLVDTEKEEFNNFFPSNDPTSDNLLDMNKRPMTDFFHNNMVPYFGSNVKQDMRGTGVEGDLNLLANSGTDGSTPAQTKLSYSTGLDSTYLHKREVPNMFSAAEQQTGWVYGSPNFRPDMSRYKENMNNIRNDLKPVEPIQVGPGLNTDPSIPAQGGFHEYTRILPNNVNDYKVNQLPGRVTGPKHNSAGLPTSYPGVGGKLNKDTYGVPKNRPESFWDQVRRPTMTNKVGFQPNLDYNKPDYNADFKPRNAIRDQTSYGLGNTEYKKVRENFNGGYNVGEDGNEVVCVNENVSIGQGPLGSLIGQTPVRSETWMSIDNNIRSRSDCNVQPDGNPNRPGFGMGNIASNYYVNETDRGTVNPTMYEQVNANRQGQGSTFYTYTDLPKTRTAETTEFSYSGNAARGNQAVQKFWTYIDTVPTTTRETTEYSYIGAPQREGQDGKSWKFSDAPKTSNKETTEYSYAGGLCGSAGNFAEMNRSLFTGFDNE